MKKTVKIDGHSVELNSSAGWLFEYQEQFGHDILPDVMPLLEALLQVVGAVIPQLGEKKEVTLGDAAVAFSKIKDEGSLSDAVLSLSGMESTTFFKIAWAMAKNSDPDTPGLKEWLNSFETMSLDTLLPALLKLVIESSLSSKNAKSLLETLGMAKRSASKSSLLPESTEG